jgi:hypothetical protein
VGEDPTDAQMTFELRFRLSGDVYQQHGTGFVHIRGEGSKDGMYIRDVIADDVQLYWSTGNVTDQWATRTTNLIRSDAPDFRIRFLTWIYDHEQEEEWYEFVTSHGIEFRRPFDVHGSGHLSYLSLTGRVPSMQVWKCFLSDMEKRRIGSLEAEGPMPWPWEGNSNC